MAYVPSTCSILFYTEVVQLSKSQLLPVTAFFSASYGSLIKSHFCRCKLFFFNYNIISVKQHCKCLCGLFGGKFWYFNMFWPVCYTKMKNFICIVLSDTSQIACWCVCPQTFVSVCVVLKISGSFLLGINGLFFFNHFNRIASSCWCHASVRSPFMQRESFVNQ